MDGAYIRQLRQAAGFSLREVAKAAGMATTTVWALEHNKNGVRPKHYGAVLIALEQLTEQRQADYNEATGAGGTH